MAEVPLIKTNERRLQASADHHEVFVNVSLSNGSRIFLLTYICGRRDAGCRFDDDDDAPDVTWLICTRERRQEISGCRLCLCITPGVSLFVSLDSCDAFQGYQYLGKFFFFFFRCCCSQTELQSVPSPTSDRRGAMEVAGNVCVCEITALHHISIN